MPDRRLQSRPTPELPIHTLVTTKDGPGRIIEYMVRHNTNGGPGTRCYLVRLNDGRVRGYNKSGVRKP